MVPREGILGHTLDLPQLQRQAGILPDLVPKPSTLRWAPTTSIQAVNQTSAVHVLGWGPRSGTPGWLTFQAVSEPAPSVHCQALHTSTSALIEPDSNRYSAGWDGGRLQAAGTGNRPC